MNQDKRYPYHLKIILFLFLISHFHFALAQNQGVFGQSAIGESHNDNYTVQYGTVYFINNEEESGGGGGPVGGGGGLPSGGGPVSGAGPAPPPIVSGGNVVEEEDGGVGGFPGDEGLIEKIAEGVSKVISYVSDIPKAVVKTFQTEKQPQEKQPQEENFAEDIQLPKKSNNFLKNILAVLFLTLLVFWYYKKERGEGQ